MKGSLLAIAMFALGIMAAHLGFVTDWVISNSHSLASWTLYVLIAMVGFEFGHDNLIENLRKIDMPMFIVPVVSVIATLIVTVAVGAIIGRWSATDYMAVGSGMGYYSLSSLLILDMRAETLGVTVATQLAMLAFLTNMSRELTALFGAPLFARWFGRQAPVAAAGVTSLDVTLPVILRVSGQDMMLVAVINGIILELAVPLMVTLFCSL